MSGLLTARFTEEAGLLSRPAWLLDLTDADGHRGRGLAAPLPGFSAEGADEVTSCLGYLADHGFQLAFASVDGLRATLEAASWPPSVAHAVEQAGLGLLASREGVTVFELLDASDAAVPRHVLVGDGGSAQLAMATGAAALKIKVQGGEDPLKAVREVRQAVGPQMRLHVDVNGHWSAAEADRHLPELEALGVALVEEPVAERDLVALARLRQTTSLTIAADESCRTAADLEALIAEEAADAVVLKPMLIGGALRTAALAHRAAEAGLEVLITHCFDGPLGQASMWLAAALSPRTSLRTVSAMAAPTDALPHPLEAAATARPEHEALTFAGETLSYAELADRAARFATWLHAQGVREGQVVGLRAPADLGWIVAFHGITWLGAIAAPLDPREGASAAQAEALEAGRPTLVLGPAELASVRLATPRAAAPWRLSAARVALFTSGTTRGARSVFLSASQLVCSAMGSRARLGHAPDDRWLCCLPLHHVGGLSIVLRAAWNRTTVVLESGFDAKRVARRLGDGEASMVSLVPTMLSRVLDVSEALHERLRVVLLGGAAAPEALLERARSLGVPLARTWGMTEAASQVATAPPGDHAPGLPPLPLTEVSALDGVLTIASPLVGASTLATGDRGWVGEDGRVHVVGRRDQIVVSGGENLDGAAIEAALCAHPGVAEACVVAMPDATWGQRPGACLVAANPEPPAEEALRRLVGERLPAYAFPDRVVWVEALPRTALGKVSRRRVAAHLVGSQSLPKSEGHLHGTEGAQVDAGVDVAGGGPDESVGGAGHLEVKGDRGLAQAADGDADGELLAHAHGPLEVGLGVDQGHPPALGVEDLAQGIVGAGAEALVGGVAVLEDPPEERDPSPIDLIETHDQSMFEHQEHSGRRTP